MINNKFVKLAVLSAKKAGKIIRKGFYLNKNVSMKGKFDPVTEYDKASEKIIVKTIKKYFKNHDILTEEELSENNNSDYKWIIDPIDGTVNFIHTIPFIAVSIALEYKGEIIAGVVYNPIINECFYAYKGGGAFLNGKKINVSGTNKAEKSIVVTGIPYNRDGRVDHLISPITEIIKDYQSFRRLGSAAIDLAYVAAGRIDAFYEEGLKPWDTAAGMILVNEAGGAVSDYKNRPYSIYNNMILATNRQLHNDLVKVLKDVGEI